MNLPTVPREAIERMQAHRLARKLGPIQTWSEEQLYMVAAHAYQIPLLDIAFADVDGAFFRAHESFFIRTGQIPLRVFSDVLVVCDCDPWDERKIQDLLQEFELGVKRILISHRNYDMLLGSLSRFKPEPPRFEEEKGAPVFLPNLSWDTVEHAQIFHEIVRRADLMQASDIHLEPAEGQMRVRFRVHGDLLVQRKLSSREGDEVLKAIKLDAHLLTSSSGTFQSSRIRLPMPRGTNLDLRVEVAPTVDGESVVIRLLDFKSIDRLIDQLNLPVQDYPKLLESISKTSGLIIVTGPTGSGKTTTLYTILQHLNKNDVKVITIEDPVEYRIRGFSQIQVDPDRGITFPNSIRSTLRQDPDVMLIGEVRDEESAKLAVSAAETGHLVFTTLHTKNAIETLTRIERLGVDRYQLQMLLRLAIAQRLIGVLCPSCKTGREIKPYEREILDKLEVRYDPDQVVYEKRGCSRCNGVGTVGRSAVYSFFYPTEEIREMIGTNCPILDIIKKAREGGFKTVMEHALVQWLNGTASFSEIHALED